MRIDGTRAGRLDVVPCEHLLENPHLYRMMFMEAPIDDVDLTVGLNTFGH